MCHWSSHEYERRLGTDPTRSFFQALRDLFRRTRRPQVEAPEARQSDTAARRSREPQGRRAGHGARRRGVGLAALYMSAARLRP